MRTFLEKLAAQPRQLVLLWLTVLVVVVALAAVYWVFPTYDAWRDLRCGAQMEAVEHARLKANLAMGQRVDEQFQQVAPKAFQDASDQITVSQFLIELETLARLPSLTLINARPMPARQQGSCKTYAVKLSLSGRLHEILQFVSQVTSGESIVGLEGFSLRGVQDRHLVECTLNLWMVRLLAEPGRGGHRLEGGPGDNI